MGAQTGHQANKKCPPVPGLHNVGRQVLMARSEAFINDADTHLQRETTATGFQSRQPIGYARMQPPTPKACLCFPGQTQ